MRRLLIWTARGIGAVLAVGFAAGLLGWAYLWTGLPQTEGRLTLAGLNQPVDILRDADGVPHIFAQSLEDASFALGFAHAQDRLFQMDFQRRLAAGRLAEVVGSIALPSDRAMRTLGVYALAERTAEQMPPDMKRQLDAYSRGVNAYLEARQGALPPEYYLLWTEPEPWRDADSLVWGRLMALTLSGNARGEALRARLSKRLSPAEMADLFAEENTGAVTLPDPPDQIRVDAPIVPFDDAQDRLYAAFLDNWPASLGPSTASNAWVLDGARTQSGKPLLANDPHLGFTAPALWYLARISTPEGERAGATVPGLPFPILGHNGRLAWGLTTTTADTQDLFVETLLDGDRYQTPDGPAALEIREERIDVAWSDPVTIRVRTTRHGPLISDVDPNMAAAAAPGTALALASTALRADDRSMEAVWRIGLARSVAEARAALAFAHAPMQNAFFADVDGGAGVLAAAKVPIRGSGDGFMPADGASGRQDWRGWVPTDMLPEGTPPPGGYLVNANNRLVGRGYPFFISRDWDASFRADRIESLLDATTENSVEAHVRIQLDPFSGAADRLLPILLEGLPRDPKTEAAAELLRRWDRRMDRDRPEPLIFAAWQRALWAAMIGPSVGEALPMIGGPRAGLIERTLLQGGPWCPATAAPDKPSCRDLVASTLASTVNQLSTRYGKDINSWRWGATHQALHAHPAFGRLPVLGRLLNITLPTDGGDDTVNRGQVGRGRGGREADPLNFAHVHGSGYRAVYDLADLGKSQLMIATGQSGHPLSPHYRDLAEAWRDGLSRTLAGTREEILAREARLLSLAPL